ncbi:MAG: excinuclease ABC subunit UvrA [Mucinivorans sp.]
MSKEIHIKGARVHNLKNIELKIAHNQLVVVTGLSGSGKSTLAFDTLFAEGQRRYVESLSAYTRQFLGRIEKPDVDSITGIAPAIAVEQKVSSTNPRSTVGTTTEIYDYMRLLFARVGHTFSPVSGAQVRMDSVDDVVRFVLAIPLGTRALVCARLVQASGQGLIERLTLLLSDGFARLFVGDLSVGRVVMIEDFIADIVEGQDVMVVVDRLVGGEMDRGKVFDSLQRAMELGGDSVEILLENLSSDADGWTAHHFSRRFEADGIKFIEPTEYLFSYNNPLGACPRCEGYGRVVGIDENLVIPDKSKSIFDDAIVCWRGETMSLWKNRLVAAAERSKLPIHKPFYELTDDQKLLLWTGNKYFDGLNCFFEFLEKERYKIQYRVMLSRYTGKSICPECNGTRLRVEAMYVRVGDRTIAELSHISIDDLLVFFSNLVLDEHDAVVAERLMQEITTRLRYLVEVGLGYLTLDRTSATLSGGESQRINLATSLGSSLVGSLYILDEPSIGLHPRDTQRLGAVLRELVNIGNTVIVVEHEEQIIRSADTLIDMGPAAGVHGGEVVYNGPLSDLAKASKRSLTAAYLLGKMKIDAPKTFRKWNSYVEIVGARENNLKNISVKFPLGVITCVTGVSGSGKSSLVSDLLYPALRREVVDTGNRPGDYDRLDGDVGRIKGIEFVDQNPIGKSMRSNPVTYIKAYDEIRKLFAEEPAARAARMESSSFSFNIAGGRCEECKGEGVIRVEMQFMADVELTCEVCGGRRFKEAVLDVKYRGKSIYDVLEMSVDEAIVFFGVDKKSKLCSKIVDKLSVLQSVGLGYVKLGQSSSTLSGGESQRVKLAFFLLRENSAGQNVFIFDEPTTGLHFDDIKKLLIAFNALVDKGHTVIIVEHNMDVIKCADWIIDLGPEAGHGGGTVVFEGTPKDILKCKNSYTGQYMAAIKNL